MLELMLTLKHLGAVQCAAASLEALCKLMHSSPPSRSPDVDGHPIHRIPEQWLARLLTCIKPQRDDESSIIYTHLRRSRGLTCVPAARLLTRAAATAVAEC